MLSVMTLFQMISAGCTFMIIMKEDVSALWDGFQVVTGREGHIKCE